MRTQTPTSYLAPFFRFPLQDPPSRSRFFMGAALFLGGLIVPILPGLLVYGYVLRILRSSAHGDPPSMQPWNDWSAFLSLGFRGTLVNLVYALPGLVVFIAGMAAYFGAFILVPLTSGAEGRISNAGVVLLILGMGAFFLSMALAPILLALGTIPLPVSVTHFVMKDRFASAFHVGEWWPILAANRLGYFISFVVIAGVFAIASLGFIALYHTFVLLCFAYLLMIPLTFYAMLVAAALFGEAYREGNAVQHTTP